MNELKRPETKTPDVCGSTPSTGSAVLVTPETCSAALFAVGFGDQRRKTVLALARCATGGGPGGAATDDAGRGGGGGGGGGGAAADNRGGGGGGGGGAAVDDDEACAVDDEACVDDDEARTGGETVAPDEGDEKVDVANVCEKLSAAACAQAAATLLATRLS